MCKFSNQSAERLFSQFLCSHKIDRIPDAIPAISVDDFLVSRKIGELDNLHSDIQMGAEMLLSASQSFKERRINYLFISMHWDKIHTEIKKQILNHNYYIGCDNSPCNSYSSNGLIFASRQPINTINFENK